MANPLRRWISPLRAFTVAVLPVMISAAFASAGTNSTGPQDFTLHNSIGSTIMELYVSPVSTDDWEEDVLGEDVLAHGESVDITFDGSRTDAEWDLKVVTEEGKSLVWRELDLLRISEVTLLVQNGRTVARTR